MSYQMAMTVLKNPDKASRPREVQAMVRPDEHRRVASLSAQLLPILSEPTAALTTSGLGALTGLRQSFIMLACHEPFLGVIKQVLSQDSRILKTAPTYPSV